MTDGTSAEFPGPQRRTRSTWFGSVGFAILFALIAIMTGHSLIAANLSPESSVDTPWYWQIKHLKPDQGLMAMIALLTVYYVRHQLAFGLRPHIVYEGRFAKRTHALPREGGATDRQGRVVSVINAGSGTALIQDAVYTVQFSNDDRVHQGLKYEKLLELLAAEQLNGDELFLSHISSGYAFAAGQRVIVFEIDKEHCAKLKRFDITLRFRSLLREEFEKEVYCVPRLAQLSGENRSGQTARLSK